MEMKVAPTHSFVDLSPPHVWCRSSTTRDRCVAVLHGRRSQLANLRLQWNLVREVSCRGARLGPPAPEPRFSNGSEPASSCYCSWPGRIRTATVLERRSRCAAFKFAGRPWPPPPRLMGGQTAKHVEAQSRCRDLLACCFDRISAGLLARASAKTRQSSKRELSSAPATGQASNRTPGRFHRRCRSEHAHRRSSRRNEVRRPHTRRPEPVALVPSAIGTSQVATATAEPELEPLGERGVEGTDCSRLVLPR
jgi:hypothetical protein